MKKILRLILILSLLISVNQVFGQKSNGRKKDNLEQVNKGKKNALDKEAKEERALKNKAKKDEIALKNKAGEEKSALKNEAAEIESDLTGNVSEDKRNVAESKINSSKNVLENTNSRIDETVDKIAKAKSILEEKFKAGEISEEVYNEKKAAIAEIEKRNNELKGKNTTRKFI